MTPPRRQLGLGVTAAIVIANMIGTGVFTGAGFNAQSLHDPMTILLAWTIGGVIALCGAMAYAELGSMMPKAGGEYVYLREAYHPAVGFMSGWVSLTAGFSAPLAGAAISFAIYVSAIAGLGEATPWIHIGPYVCVFWERLSFNISIGPQQAIAMGLILAVTAMHSFDTKIGGWIQAAFTAAKVLLIALFILGGLLFGAGDWGHLASQDGGFSNVLTENFAIQLMYIGFAYSGWNAAAYIAGDVREPSRTLPRALLLGTGAVMLLYVLLNLVFFYAVPSDVLGGPRDDFKPVIEVGDLAARSLFGDSVGSMVSSVIALALVSAVSAMIMAGPRVYAAMAADRALPRKLAKHNARGVPVFAVLTQGVLGCLFVMVGDLGQLIRFVGFTLTIFATLAVVAVFVLRAKGYKSTYKTFGYPITPIVFITASLVIVYEQTKNNPMESIITVVVLGIGALIYLFAVHGKGPLPNENDPVDAPGPVEREDS